MMRDETSTTPASTSLSDRRNDEKHDVERVEEVPPPGLTTLDGGTVQMTWKTWIVIFVRPFAMPRSFP
jgi:hypothetical protein